ncbi:FAD-binding oxidoreductase [Mesobaculum littorinae]|uniref:FAD-binding oxidoreductase n=1 Tax=Mesobaculum littorinae TaxID=2486419 RepID=A0A438AIS5_9RHOB|nr:FAD-binding oxidoreductase [Mesobaculum littorinae]RVV98610.1 FAD-binding oxidoreductase [Mesobaculum littorinae]
MNLLFANDAPGAYPPSWYAETARAAQARPALSGEVRADVCVVGAGYTGLSAALHLAQAGASVVVVEAHRAGFGASGRNGGQVGSGQRQGQDWLEARMGHAAAQALWQIAEDAKALIRDLDTRHGMGIGWAPGIVNAERTDQGATAARAYADRLARDYGYTQAEPLDRAGIRALIGSPHFAGGLIDWGAGHVHPLRLALGLARAAEAAGAQIYEGTVVHDVDPGPGARVHTDGGVVRADHVILAANGYLGGLSGDIASRVMPINNFVIATEPLGARASDLLAQDVAAFDSNFVVNYWRLSEDRRLIFGGGESYSYRFPADIAAKVRRPMLEVYPQLHGARITHAWGGTLAITRSRMPYFARVAPGVLTASGYSGHGVAMAVMAGRLLAEATRGDSAGFDLLARVPTPAFPGGSRLRAPLLTLAMSWFAMRDRLGV